MEAYFLTLLIFLLGSFVQGLTGFGFALFVRLNFCHGALVGSRIILDGNLRGHATHRVRTATVTGLYQ